MRDCWCDKDRAWVLGWRKLAVEWWVVKHEEAQKATAGAIWRCAAVKRCRCYEEAEAWLEQTAWVSWCRGMAEGEARLGRYGGQNFMEE